MGCTVSDGNQGRKLKFPEHKRKKTLDQTANVHIAPRKIKSDVIRVIIDNSDKPTKVFPF